MDTQFHFRRATARAPLDRVPLEKDIGELFRTDAKGEEGKVTMGGWLSIYCRASGPLALQRRSRESHNCLRRAIRDAGWMPTIGCAGQCAQEQ
eukprot:2461517-Amphidinium_carterae.1